MLIHGLLFWFCFYYGVSPAIAISGSVLIDDTDGDEITGLKPVYDPPDGWVASPCPGCGIQPDPSRAGSRTWHDTTATDPDNPRSVTLRFNGTGIHVYCIMGNQIQYITTSMRIAFILDGEQLPEFTRQPDQNQEIYYHRSIFDNDSLTPGPHELKMSAIATSSNDSGHSAFLFDFAQYTPLPQDNQTSTTAPAENTSQTTPITSTTTSSSSPQISPHQSPSTSHTSNFPLGAIIGIVVASVAVLLAILAFVLIRRRRSRSRGGSRKTDWPNAPAPTTQIRIPQPTSTLTVPPPHSGNFEGNPFTSSADVEDGTPHLLSDFKSQQPGRESIHREPAPSAQRLEKLSRRFPLSQQATTASSDGDVPGHDPLPDETVAGSSSYYDSRPESGSEGSQPAVGGDPRVDQRVEALQAEIARLRAHFDVASPVEAPPAYER